MSQAVTHRCAATSAIRRCSSASSASTRSTPSFTWRRRPSSAIANRNPVSTFESNIARHLDAARGLPPQPDGEADRRRLVGQGLRRPRSAALRRGDAAAGPHPVRRQQVVRGPDRADLRRHLRPAGGDHPLRQFLRRRRPQLESHRAGHDPLDRCAASARSSAPTGISSATTSTSRTAPPPTCSWPRSSRATPSLRGEAFNFSNEEADHGARPGQPDLASDGLRPRARGPERGDATKSANSTSAPRRRDSSSAGGRSSRSTKGCSARSTGIASFSARPHDAAAGSCGLERSAAWCSPWVRRRSPTRSLTAERSRDRRTPSTRSSSSLRRAARWCRSPRRCRPRSCSATTSTSRRSRRRWCGTPGIWRPP